MTDIGNLLNSSIPVDLEREVLICTEVRAHKQGHHFPARTFLVTPLVSEAQLRYYKHRQQKAIHKRNLRTDFTQIARITGPRLGTPGKCSVWLSK